MTNLEQLNIKRLAAKREYSEVYKAGIANGNFDMSSMVPASNKAESTRKAWLQEMDRVKGTDYEGL